MPCWKIQHLKFDWFSQLETSIYFRDPIEHMTRTWDGRLQEENVILRKRSEEGHLRDVFFLIIFHRKTTRIPMDLEVDIPHWASQVRAVATQLEEQLEVKKNIIYIYIIYIYYIYIYIINIIYIIYI